MALTRNRVQNILNNQSGIIYEKNANREKFNRVVEGRITAVDSGTSTYTVVINGDTSTGVHSFNDTTFVVNDVVRVIYYNNNQSDKEILTKVRR